MGRKKKIWADGEKPKNTTIQVEPEIIKVVRKKYGSIANAIRHAALN